MIEEIKKAWKGWRLEFEQEYGSDMDGAAEYSSYSEFDWTIDLAEIIETQMMGWLKGNVGRVGEYEEIYIEEISAEEIKVHFTCGYGITLSVTKPGYSYNYSFGHSDYTNAIRLIAPGIKHDTIARFSDNGIHCRRKCLGNLKPKEVLVPESIEGVDLGLSVLWAPFNVGAASPEELGDSFAWSEIEPEKKGYSYIRGLLDENGKTMFTERGDYKYEFSGMKKYDAATAIWGDGWRTPTEDELWELKCYCKWEWKKVGGCMGYKVKGKSGKHIFLPLDEESKDWEGRSGSSYWSSHAGMIPGGQTKGSTLDISEYDESDTIYNYHISDCDTAVPLFIRAVKDK